MVYLHPDEGLYDIANMVNYKTLKEILLFVGRIQAVENLHYENIRKL